MQTNVVFETRVFPFDDDLPNKLNELEAQGYKILPGAQPVVVYQVFRVAGMVEAAAAFEAAAPEPAPPSSDKVVGFGMFQMDDSLVHIIRDGKPVVE